jgi:hypothetical protein
MNGRLLSDFALCVARYEADTFSEPAQVLIFCRRGWEAVREAESTPAIEAVQKKRQSVFDK